MVRPLTKSLWSMDEMAFEARQSDPVVSSIGGRSVSFRLLRYRLSLANYKGIMSLVLLVCSAASLRSRLVAARAFMIYKWSDRKASAREAIVIIAILQ